MAWIWKELLEEAYNNNDKLFIMNLLKEKQIQCMEVDLPFPVIFYVTNRVLLGCSDEIDDLIYYEIVTNIDIESVFSNETLPKIEHKEQYRRYEENYHNRFKAIDLPRDYYYVSVLGQSDDARNQFDFTDYLAWREDDILCFFPERVRRDEYFQSDFYVLDDLTLALSRIKVEAINSFRIQLDGIEKNGKVSEEFTIEAGVIRGMVASDVLDLFGNEIYIDTLDYEARKCTLFYFDEDRQKQRLVFCRE